MTKKENRPYWKTTVGITGTITAAAAIALSTFQNPGEEDSIQPPPVTDASFIDDEVITKSLLARNAAERGEFEAALEYIDQAVNADPEDIPANLLKAELLFRLYRADEMRPVLEGILRQDPEHFEAHANMAFALRFSGELDEAEKHVEWCLLRRPDFLPILRIRAEIFRDRGDSNRALTEIRTVLKTHPDDVDARILEAEILMYQRDFEAAYRCLSPLSEVARRNHRIAALMAQICQLIGKPTEATEYRAILDSHKQTKRPNQ